MRRTLFAAALLGVCAFGAPRPWSTEDVWAWRTVSDPQISADGAWVVYVLGWNDQATDASYSNLWLVSAEGKEGKTLTEGAFRDTSPRWSPDGSRIAYLSNRGGKTQIHVRRVETGEDRQVTDLPEAPSNIAWSPDGSAIAYTARAPGKPEWSFPMQDAPPGAKWAAPAIVVTRLKWRSDGSGIVPPGYVHVFVVSADGGSPRQITSGDFDHRTPAWLPDGQWIVASAKRIPDADYSLQGDDLFAFRVSDGAVKQLTDRAGPDEEPAPSPDGSKIAFLGNDYALQSYRIRKLYVMDADGSRVRALSGMLDRDAANPRWSSDSRTVYFQADDRGSTRLYAARSDGAVRPVTPGGQRFGEYGVAPAFGMADNGRVVTVRSTPSAPGDVVTFPVDRPDDVLRLSNANGALLAGRATGTAEEIEYPAFDGKPLQGWIVKPPGFDPSRKYPLLLDIHGGPHMMYGVEFNLERQIAAARGFVVLYTNPRGSTGYGEDFGNIIHTRYPGDDYLDLMKGVDAMLAKGYVDAKRLTVTGGSGGGLLTAWIVGHTDRFAAAVSQYPVTNWFTQVGTADNGYNHGAVWMKAMPWENPEQYMAHSPIFFARNFKTPTMVLTGEADLRTPSAEAEELYFALKARKVESALVRIPDEPHGIRGAHPSHRIAKIEAVLAWLETHSGAR